MVIDWQSYIATEHKANNFVAQNKLYQSWIPELAFMHCNFHSEISFFCRENLLIYRIPNNTFLVSGLI